MREGNIQLEQAEKEMIKCTEQFHFSADLEGTDTLKLHARIDATPKGESNFAVLTFLIPLAQEFIRTEHGMSLEGTGVWDGARNKRLLPITRLLGLSPR